jgi:hypothetical protein
MVKKAPQSLEVKFKIPKMDRIDDLVSTSLKIYFKNFSIILLYISLFFLPAFLIKNYLLFLFPVESKWLKIIISADVLGIVGTFLTPAIFYAVIQAMNKSKLASMKDSLRWGSHCWARNFKYKFIVGIFVILGFICLVIPGFIFSIWYCLITPIVTIEGEKQKDPLERSKSLAQGHMWMIFGSAFLICFLQAIPGFAFSSVRHIFSFAGLLEKPLVMSNHWILSTASDFIGHVFYFSLSIMYLVFYLSFSSKK